MKHGFYAKEVIGPDDVTFSTVWLIAGFLAFGVVAVLYNAWLLKKSEEPGFKQGCVLAGAATVYLGITSYVFIWGLVHAIDNSHG
ncbi:hypothetical protein ACGFWD_34315 [Streptomyces sp. NPDC048448]|uniref:hypothetical protein n=1 Tax=unclassified Streptomyces TaxID=2593676 RepID=UPI0034455DCD